MQNAIVTLQALAHPDRMRLFRLLVRHHPAALRTGEIGTILGQAPSTLSGHLAALHRAGLCVQRRDGRSILYSLNPVGTGDLIRYLVADCCRGRPDLCDLTLDAKEPAMTDRPFNVLFICSGNSARSIFAEAILDRLGEGRFVAYSAGFAPQSALNPFAVRMLGEKGHDIAGLRSKHISEFQGKDAPVMDFVFTVCDTAANEDCPAWHGQPVTAHWGMPDPARATGTDAERSLAFQEAYRTLLNRIRAFSALRIEDLSRLSLQARLDEIGQDHAAATH
ncbi:MAG: metalloregulator ArsR/SmtB family transcription factor [Jannaschia sp.]